MKGIAALLKKELLEQVRTFRFVIVGSIFLFFGMTTPLLLKYLPEILKLAGVNIPDAFPVPTAVMALNEYASTIGQEGVLVAVLIAMGAIAGEFQKGTAVMVLSKPVSRAAFVTAKFIAISLSFLVSLVAASVFCFIYTVFLIGDAGVAAFAAMNLFVFVFLMFCLAVTLLFSSILKSSVAAGGISIGILIVQAVFSSLPVIGDYMPGKLLTWGAAIVEGGETTYWPALIVTVVLTAVCLFLAPKILGGRE